MSGALGDLFVLEFTAMLAGPYAGQFLADMGAEVVKVEPLGGARGRQAPYSYACNRNKQSIAVDMQTARGREIVHSLVKQSDVLLQNFRTGVMDRLGVGYEEVSALNPRIVYCSLSGYGDRGPLREYPGQDLLIQALGGLMSFVGYEDRVSTPAGTYPSDSAGGMLSALGIMMALHEREQSGLGQHVKTSLLASLLTTMPYELTDFMTVGRVPRRPGPGHYLGGPAYGAFRALDGELVMEGDLGRMAAALGCDSLLDDERFALRDRPQDAAEMAARRARMAEHRDEIRTLLEDCVADRPRDAVLKDLNDAGVWCMPVLSVPEACEHPQIVENEMLASYEDPDMGTVGTVAAPYQLSRTPVAEYRHPPALGEQTDAVLTQRLKMTGEEIEQLRHEQVIA